MAKVIESDADDLGGGIRYKSVFAYARGVFIHSKYNKQSKIWNIYINGSFFDTDSSEKAYMTHPNMLSKVLKKGRLIDSDISGFIRGRISKNGNIHIHDLYHREYTIYARKNWDYLVDKTVDCVYRFMSDDIS